MKTTFKIGPPLQKIFLPPPPLPVKILPEIFSWWLLTLTTTLRLMLNQKWYQVSKPEMEFHIIKIIYAALPAFTNRKDNNFMRRRLYIDKTHTVLDIFRFVVFVFFEAPCMVLCSSPKHIPACRSLFLFVLLVCTRTTSGILLSDGVQPPFLSTKYR